jgi:hypothetical protein
MRGVDINAMNKDGDSLPHRTQEGSHQDRRGLKGEGRYGWRDNSDTAPTYAQLCSTAISIPQWEQK